MVNWKLVRDFAARRIKREYMLKHYHDRACERCLTWTNETDGAASCVDDPADPMFELMTCKKCGHVSRWDCRSMIPYLVPTEFPTADRFIRPDQ